MTTLQSEFLYNGVHRLSYGWQNPNFAAIVLVCLLPLLWPLTDSKSQKGGPAAYGSWLLEILLGLMVVWTFSRGAVLAWAAGAVFYGLILPRFAGNSSEPSVSRQHFFLRMIILVIAAGSNGVFGRFATVAEGDASAVNRLELWVGGLSMLRHAPLTGWGSGNSGLAFMQWFQNPASTFGVGGMVNSYLWLAVEQGLPALFVALSILLVPCGLGLLTHARELGARRPWVNAATTGLVCFMVGSLFSTFWAAWSVLWAPALLMLILIYALIGKITWRIFRCSLGWAMSAATLVCTGFYVSGQMFSRRGSWDFQPPFSQPASFAQKNSAAKTDLVFLPDYQVLGPYYGRTLRGMVADNSAVVRSFAVLPPEKSTPASLSGLVVAFGPRYQDLRDVAPEAKVILVCPAGDPADLPSGVAPSLLVLPAQDEIGYQTLWREWAKRVKCPIKSLETLGQEILPAASPMLAEILKTP